MAASASEQLATERERYEVALKAFARTLDPHSRYLTPEEARAFALELDENKRVGIGVELIKTVIDAWTPPATMIVEEVFPGSAAYGVLSRGSQLRLITVRGKELKDLRRNPSQRDQLAVTEQAPEVELEIVGQAGTVSLKAETFDWNSVQGLNMQRNRRSIGYIKVRAFTFGMAKAVEQWIRRLETETAAEAILLDLRGNGGGLLDEALKLADLLKDGGFVVRKTGNPKKPHLSVLGSERSFSAEVPGTVTERPVVLLVDSDSASATEIFTAAVWKDLLVLGDRTFGKGIGQNSIPVDEGPNYLGGALWITTFRYEFEEGFSPQFKGISPHIEVPHPGLAPIIAARDARGETTFLREEDYGAKAIQPSAQGREPVPSERLRSLIAELEEDPQNVEAICKDVADCQLERALAYLAKIVDIKSGELTAQVGPRKPTPHGRDSHLARSAASAAFAR